MKGAQPPPPPPPTQSRSVLDRQYRAGCAAPGNRKALKKPLDAKPTSLNFPDTDEPQSPEPLCRSRFICATSQTGIPCTRKTPRMCLRVKTYICISVCTQTHTHMYIQRYVVFVYIYTYTCVCVFMYKYMHIDANIDLRIIHVYYMYDTCTNA